MLDFLPDALKCAIDENGLSSLREIRIRVGNPVYLIKNGQAETLKFHGKTVIGDALIINYIIKQLSDYSLFTVENSLKRGFITSKSGERIGVCGECVYEANEIRHIKNLTSLCIRIPQELKGVSDKLFSVDLKDKNILILSPPACGKTTMLRDLVRNVSNRYLKNILVCDERNEISSTDKKSAFDLGNTCDVILFSSKEYAMTTGVRVLNPSIVAMDELVCDSEAKSVCETVYSGVNVICTAHADSYGQFLNRSFGQILHKNNIFDVVFTLGRNPVGNLEEIIYGGEKVL